MADIELELLSRAIMTGKIDQLVAADIEGRHWFDPETRKVFETCVEHYAIFRSSMSLEAVKRHHPGYQIVPCSDELAYLIKEFRDDRAVKIGTSATMDIHELIQKAESGDKESRSNFTDKFME